MKTSGPFDGAVEERTIKLASNKTQEQIGGDVPALKEREAALIIALFVDPCGTIALVLENQKTDRRTKRKSMVDKHNRLAESSLSASHTHTLCFPLVSLCSRQCVCVCVCNVLSYCYTRIVSRVVVMDERE